MAMLDDPGRVALTRLPVRAARGQSDPEQHGASLDPGRERIRAFPDEAEARTGDLSGCLEHLFGKLGTLHSEQIVFRLRLANLDRLVFRALEFCCGGLERLCCARRMRGVGMVHAPLHVGANLEAS